MKTLGLFAIIAAILLFAFIGMGMVMSSTPEGQERAAERDAIDACREQQNDELQPLGVRRAVRDACDRMEADYRRKWNRSP